MTEPKKDNTVSVVNREKDEKKSSVKIPKKLTKKSSEDEISSDVELTSEEIFRKKYPKEKYMTVHQIRENSNRMKARKTGEKLTGVFEPGMPFNPNSAKLDYFLEQKLVKKVR